MNIDGLKQKTTTFIQDLRSIREDAIRGNLTKDRTLSLMRTKLREYEENAVSEPWPFSDDEAGDFFKVVKWHYWNILYSLIGDELADIDPEFKLGEVPYMLPGIEILFETDQPFLPEPALDTQPPERKEAERLPPIIQAVLNDGLLDAPVNGKYLKKGDKKDAEIIEWIFDYSGYGDSLTTELYMQYIQTHCKSTTIQDYITRNKKPLD
jgi:hypothetical protein